VESLLNVYYSIQSSTPNGGNFVGLAISEYADEWWRSSLYQFGYDTEGCPNTNSFAQTPCGYLYSSGNVLSVSYTGLFRVWPCPFSMCIHPKEAAFSLSTIWNGNYSSNATFINCPTLFLFQESNFVLMIIVIFALLANINCFYNSLPFKNMKKKPIYIQ